MTATTLAAPPPPGETRSRTAASTACAHAGKKPLPEPGGEGGGEAAWGAACKAWLATRPGAGVSLDDYIAWHAAMPPRPPDIYDLLQSLTAEESTKVLERLLRFVDDKCRWTMLLAATDWNKVSVSYSVYLLTGKELAP